MNSSIQVDAWVGETYEWIHSHPELAFDEICTASLLASKLSECGFAVTTGVGGTGVVAVLRRGHGRSVVLRAELDALPLDEDTGVEFSSTQAGVMHACGHDVHCVAVVSAAARCAVDDSWGGTLVVVLQPAEEEGTGARAMLNDGLLAMIPEPDCILAQHVSPVSPVGVIGHRAGQMLAGSDVIDVRFDTSGGHGSSPQGSTDLALLVAQLTTRLHTIVSRDVAAAEAAVLTVSDIWVEGSTGSLPRAAGVEVNVRSTTAQVRRRMLERIADLAHAEARGAGGSVRHDVRTTRSVPPVVNNKPLVDGLMIDHRQGLTGARVIEVPPAMASDDIAVLAEASGAPTAYWFIGSLSRKQFMRRSAGEEPAGCHSAKYLPSSRTLPMAHAAMLTATKGRLGTY